MREPRCSVVFIALVWRMGYPPLLVMPGGGGGGGGINERNQHMCGGLFGLVY